jgi:hypothetical protein
MPFESANMQPPRMKISIVAVLSLLVVACGCSRSEDKTPAVIKVGVREDGQPFFDWEGTMVFSTSSSGSVDWSSGAKTHATFSRPSWKSSIEVDLVVTDSEDDRYSVDGTLASPVPIRLELLGTSESEKEADSALSFPAGTNKVRFDGKLYATFSKKG